MKDYNTQDKGHSHKALILLKRIQSDIEKLRVDRIIDIDLRRFLENKQGELDDLKTIIVNKPRFKYEEIQQEIDRLHKIDNNLNGIIIYLDWKDGNNRAFFKHRIGKAS